MHHYWVPANPSSGVTAIGGSRIDVRPLGWLPEGLLEFDAHPRSRRRHSVGFRFWEMRTSEMPGARPSFLCLLSGISQSVDDGPDASLTTQDQARP